MAGFSLPFNWAIAPQMIAAKMIRFSEENPLTHLAEKHYM
jgi:hypothetical protein